MSDFIPTRRRRLWGSSSLVFRYTPGQTFVGESFTRSTIGTYVDANGIVQTAAINAKRDAHYAGGLRGYLNEQSRTNIVLWNRDLTNAAWVKTTMTAALDATGADGVLNSATTLTATGANATVLQTITDASKVRSVSARVKQTVGSGTIQMTMDNGATWTTIAVTGTLTRFSIPVQTLANPVVGFRIVTSGDAIVVDFVQCENGGSTSSDIATTTAAVTRGADLYTIPFVSAPQAMTVYQKLTQQWSSATYLGGSYQWSIGNDLTAPYAIFRDDGVVFHRNAVPTSVTRNLGSQGVAGDVVENNAQYLASGAVTGSRSVNGGAESAPGTSAANAFAGAWSAAQITLGSLSSGSPTNVVIHSLKIALGTYAMSAMRGL